MRLGSLDLQAFGPFTNVSLNFSVGAPGGFHLIFGANEAGKSTSLRAVKAFFYGIPEASPDAHSHPPSRLRVGALVEANTFYAHLVRYRRRKNSLVDEEGTPFDEDRLREALGYLDERTFEARFGLDQSELDKGAEALLGGREQGLFAAGTAGTSVRQVLAELEREHEELFTKRGRVRPLNQAVQRYREAARSLVGLIKPPELWAEQEAARRKALETLAELKEARRRTRLDHVALSRLGSMLSQFGELEELENELGQLVISLPGGQPLDPGVRSQREKVKQQRSEVRRAAAQCQSEIERLEATARELCDPSRLEQRARLLQIRSEATTLRERLGSARNAQAALPRLRAREQTALAEVARLLDGAGIRPAGVQAALRGQADRSFLEAASQSLVAPAAATALRSLLREEEVLRAEQSTLLLRSRELCSDLESEETRDPTSALRPAFDFEWLSRVIGAARRVLEDGPPLAALKKKVLQCADAVASHHVRAGSSFEAAELGKAVLRARARSARNEEYERMRLEAEQLTLRAARLNEELEATQREIEQLHSGGSLPSVQVLEDARSARDGALRRLLLGEIPATAQTYDAIAAHVTLADKISDQLRTDASRIAHGAELEAKSTRVRAELALCRQALGEAERAIAALALLIQERLRAAGDPSSALATDVPQLLGRHAILEELLGALEELGQAKSEFERRSREHDFARDALVSALGPEAVTGHEAVELAELLSHAENFLGKAREEERFAKERAARVDQMRRRLSGLDGQLRRIEARRTELTSELARLKHHLHLSVDTSTAELEAMLAASEGALVPMTEARSAEQRQDGIVRDAEALAREIAELVSRIAPDIALQDVLAAADVLLERALRAERDHEEAGRIERELLERRTQMAQTQQVGQRTELAIADLLELTRAADLESLERMEEVSDRVLFLRDKRERILISLREKAQDAPFSELRTEASRSDHRTIFHRIEAMGEELEALNEQVSAQEAELHALEVALSRFQTADAAEVRQLVALRGEETRDLIRTYLVKRTARLLLGREVTRYASRFAGPLTTRASVLFEQLTLGRYKGIRFDPSDSELRCFTGSRDLTATELSRGARAQMYLALRIASLESYFTHREPIPLVLDDLLVDFDDERAAAAFEVLGTLAERVQILYFTHLARDLERAGDAIPNRLFSHHRIGA